ncbi:MAG: YcxB family protein [Clostridiales bacterium]|nr:YcxB family protein [Clostridiales bacterium]
MPIEFDITLTAKDMYRFNMYQTYTSFQGWLSVAISIFILVVAGKTAGEVEVTRTILYAVLGVIFLFYPPIHLLLRSKHAVASTESLGKPLHYAVDAAGIRVSREEATAELPWNQIYKMMATKSNVLIYSSRIHAYVIPREQLGEKYPALARIARENLEKYRIKMK